MDDFVREKLTHWSLADFIPAFEAEKIDKDCFFLLDEHNLSMLIPLIGPRLKFQLQFKHLQQEGCKDHPEPAVCAPVPQLPLEPPNDLFEQCATFNIREILSQNESGRASLSSLDKNQHISIKERQFMVRVLVSHLIKTFGENPTSGTKAGMALSIVEQFPFLRDSHGTGYEAWFTPGRKHRPATGFIEERLRNVRKRLRRTRGQTSLSTETYKSQMILPEPNITPDKALQLTEWLKNNIWPAAQVSQYMLDTAIHRAQWIRANGTTPVQQIIEEFPRLVDTPGMICQDFSVLHPDASWNMTENWSRHFAAKIIQMAQREKGAEEMPSNIDLLSTDEKADIAFLLLPYLLPTPPHKDGRKVSRPSAVETRKAFIDVQPVGTNIVEYISKGHLEYPFVLMLGEENRCSQAFVIISGTVMEYPSLLTAVDGCFKSFFVFDICYPKICCQIWEFIQTVVFEIAGKESNTIKLMRAQLAAMN